MEQIPRCLAQGLGQPAGSSPQPCSWPPVVRECQELLVPAPPPHPWRGSSEMTGGLPGGYQGASGFQRPRPTSERVGGQRAAPQPPALRGTGYRGAPPEAAPRAWRRQNPQGRGCTGGAAVPPRAAPPSLPPPSLPHRGALPVVAEEAVALRGAAAVGCRLCEERGGRHLSGGKRVRGSAGRARGRP